MRQLCENGLFPVGRLEDVLDGICLPRERPLSVGGMVIRCMARGAQQLVVDGFYYHTGLWCQFLSQGQCKVLYFLWLPFRLYCFCVFNLYAMYLSTDDEWLFAISILTVLTLLVVTFWMVIMVVQNNRRYSRKKELESTVEEIMKPSKNGRSKKDHN